MKVYIDGKVHDFVDKPIVVIFDEGEKELISNMDDRAKYFCSYNIDNTSPEEVENILTKLKENDHIE